MDADLLLRDENRSCSYLLKLMASGPTEPLLTLLEPAAQSLGYQIVRLKMTGRPGTKVSAAQLQIMIERADGGSVHVDDCARLSREVSALLDVSDPIGGAYMLEVSSPGIDRPLTRAGDFDRFMGLTARVEMEIPIDGRKRFVGELLGVRDGQIVLRQGGAVQGGDEDAGNGEVLVPLASVWRAKLVMDDRLMAWAKAAATPGEMQEGADVPVFGSSAPGETEEVRT
jgi:ribosome maturation factor RimP